MPRADVLALIKRREDILAGRVVPHYAESPAICRTCAFRAECDSPQLP
jgi:CRISPR-associated exonuclease Cas4